ncbi:MAG: hypothetical protein PHT54_03830 [Candidatus Nanoarchaeia archaeon]|nr:hypothetical protein [Candidatus Nanoarchaeia archaeon]
MNKRAEVFPLKDIFAVLAFLVVLAIFMFNMSSDFKKGGDIDERIEANKIDKDMDLFAINLFKTKVQNEMVIDIIVDNQDNPDYIFERVDPLIKKYYTEGYAWKIFVNEKEICCFENSAEWDYLLTKTSTEIKYPYEDKLIHIKLAIAEDKL